MMMIGTLGVYDSSEDREWKIEDGGETWLEIAAVMRKMKRR